MVREMVKEKKESKPKKVKTPASKVLVVRFVDENGNADNEAWMNARLGCVSGSRVKDILTFSGNTVKVDFWNMTAEAIIGSAAIPNEEKAMDRGRRLEPVAIARFERETGKKVDSTKQLWMREDDMKIAITPDGGMISETEAVEIKCLGYGRHLEALETGKVPDEYMPQAIQYFVVSDKLKTLYFGFYDDRFPAPLDFHYIVLKRKDLKDEIAKYLKMEREALVNARRIINKYTL